MMHVLVQSKRVSEDRRRRRSRQRRPVLDPWSQSGRRCPRTRQALRHPARRWAASSGPEPQTRHPHQSSLSPRPQHRLLLPLQPERGSRLEPPLRDAPHPLGVAGSSASERGVVGGRRRREASSDEVSGQSDSQTVFKLLGSTKQTGLLFGREGREGAGRFRRVKPRGVGLRGPARRAVRAMRVGEGRRWLRVIPAAARLALTMAVAEERLRRRERPAVRVFRVLEREVRLFSRVDRVGRSVSPSDGVGAGCGSVGRRTKESWRLGSRRDDGDGFALDADAWT